MRSLSIGVAVCWVSANMFYEYISRNENVIECMCLSA